MFILASCCDNDSGLYVLDTDDSDPKFERVRRGHGQSILMADGMLIWMSEGSCCIWKGDPRHIDWDHPDKQFDFSLWGHHGTTYDPVTKCIVTASSDNNSLTWTSLSTGKTEDECIVNPKGAHTNDLWYVPILHKQHTVNNRRLDDGFLISSFTQGITFLKRGWDESIPVYRDCNKPHSVQYHNGDVWWCNSEDQQVMRNGKVHREIEGFPRGLDWSFGENPIVGVSRHKYREQGEAGVYIDDQFFGIPAIEGIRVVNLYSIKAFEGTTKRKLTDAELKIPTIGDGDSPN